MKKNREINQRAKQYPSLKAINPSLLALKKGRLPEQELRKLIQLNKQKNEHTPLAFNYFLLATHYMENNNYSAAIENLQLCLKIRKTHGDKKEIVLTIFMLSELARRVQDYALSEELCMELICIYKNDLDDEKLYLVNLSLGFNYAALGSMENARLYYQECLDLCRQANDILGMAESLEYLAKVEIEMGNFSHAIEYLDSSHKNYEVEDDINGVVTVQSLLGDAYAGLGNYEQAKKYYEKSMKTVQKMKNNHATILALYGLGLVAIGENEYELAKQYFLTCQAIAEAYNDSLGNLLAHESLAYIEFLKGDYNAQFSILFTSYDYIDLQADPDGMIQLLEGFAVCTQKLEVPQIGYIFWGGAAHFRSTKPYRTPFQKRVSYSPYAPSEDMLKDPEVRELYNEGINVNISNILGFLDHITNGNIKNTIIS